jgi:Rrf2 family protein
MKLSLASTYALKALAYLAQQKSPIPMPSHVMAAAVPGLPKLFLLKCLMNATKAGLLRSLKGPNGGYLLARPARTISMLDIIEGVDGPMRAGVPPLGRGHTPGIDARLQKICDGVTVLTRARLAKVTLADLARAR